jgi:glycosyltransferase involved in cell wall biosynthesis
MHRHGAHVEVVTPRYAASWPEQLTIRELRVHRPAAAPRSDWSMGRYVRHLTTWLRDNGRSFDALLSDAMREESAAAIEAARSLGCPVILRCSGWGAMGDTAWWSTSRAARKCGNTARMASAVIAPSAACQRALVAAGFPGARIHRIEHGFAAGPIRTPQARYLARRALAAVNSDLATQADDPVLLCFSRMTRDSGTNLLVTAARHLIARYPNLRLWLIGDGPYRDGIYETLRSDGVRASLAMPGSFADASDLFLAADLFLQCDEDGLEYFLPSAIAAELPVVAIDCESTRAVITGAGQLPLQGDPGGLVEWVSSPTAKHVRQAIERVLDDLPAARSRAFRLRRLALRCRPQSETIKAYVELIGRLAADRGSRQRDSSIEAAS